MMVRTKKKFFELRSSSHILTMKYLYKIFDLSSEAIFSFKIEKEINKLRFKWGRNEAASQESINGHQQLVRSTKF